MPAKRQIEVFSDGCAVCEETQAMVQRLACPSCEVTVLDIHDLEVAARAKACCIHAVPAVVVDGQLGACCAGSGPIEATLKPAGIGTREAHDPAPSRRGFLKGMGAAAALFGAVPRGTFFASDIEPDAAGPNANAAAQRRRNLAFRMRTQAAQREHAVRIPDHSNNGDEALYPNAIGNFSKGLPHDAHGEVEPAAYNALVKAVTEGRSTSFDAIPLGGTVKLVDPQAGLAFDMEGTDSGQLSIPPFPALASPEAAAQAIEVYWLALLRDVAFSQYGADSGAAAAIAETRQLVCGIRRSQGRRTRDRGNSVSRIHGRRFDRSLHLAIFLSSVLVRSAAGYPAVQNRPAAPGRRC